MLAALRKVSSLRVSPMLDKGARENKRQATLFARAKKVRLADEGDFVGVWGPSGRKPAKLPLVDVHLPCSDFL